MPSERTALWLLAFYVGLLLLCSGLATTYDRVQPQVQAVSDDDGGRVP